MEPGFYPAMPREQYDAAPGIRNTELGWAAKSMAHYKLYKEQPPAETEAKRDGQLIHRAILEPEWFERSTVVIPADAPKKPTKTQLNAKKPSPESVEAIEWWRDFGVKHAGKTFLGNEESKVVARIVDAVWSDKEAGPILRRCTQREMAVFSRHGATGLLCKSLLDLLSEDSSEIWDVKTTIDGEPEPYRRAVLNFGYHRQAAFYPGHFPRLDKARPSFGHIVVEKGPPYIVSVRPFDEETIEIGKREVSALLHRIARAQETGFFPGYHNEQEETGLPLWKLRELAR